MELYEKYLWKSQSLNPSDKIPTEIQNKIPLCNLLAGVLIRECTRNYSLKFSNIPFGWLKLIISNIIIKKDVDWDPERWNSFRSWFNFNNHHIEDGIIKIEDNLTVPELKLKNSAKSKYRLTRQDNQLVKSAHCFVKPGCIVDQNDRTLIHLENIDDQNALIQATDAVNKYHSHLMSDKAHKSKDFCKNSVEHFGAYRRFTSLPYTSANTASSHNLNHRSCVDNLLNSLVPLSNYVNKFIQDYYGNMYLKLRNLSWDTNIRYTKVRTKNINCVSDNTVTHKRNATPEILSLKNSIAQTINFRIIVSILILIFEI
ncbi:hypothetical protein Glove_174g3 [Diversispora epigaea]|uniref:Uncharacterized protein n=1 Tax=Diversispora epigaea TaxID=1348612 RepID=A0A397IS54_9GLOM|nr:hypothetical protein Glove_174g3 [Diversispora epigaea]